SPAMACAGAPLPSRSSAAVTLDPAVAGQPRSRIRALLIHAKTPEGVLANQRDPEQRAAGKLRAHAVPDDVDGTPELPAERAADDRDAGLQSVGRGGEVAAGTDGDPGGTEVPGVHDPMSRDPGLVLSRRGKPLDRHRYVHSDRRERRVVDEGGGGHRGRGA